MRQLLLLIILLSSVGCSSPVWQWQDTRLPPRAEVAPDLAECRSYAAAQYRPGVPAGDPYLGQQSTASPGTLLLDQDPGDPAAAPDTWHADREPFPTTNIREESIHGVVVPYTGYPGYLDYHPGYLDALVEKCMSDRGWRYAPASED